MSKTIDNLDAVYKHLLQGIITAAKTPKIEIDKDTKTITLTIYDNTYIRIGFDTYRFEGDVSSFILYEDNCLIHLAFNTNNGLICGFIDDEEIGEDSVCIGALLFENGELESVSFSGNTEENDRDILNILTSQPITISKIANNIQFPSNIVIECGGKTYPINNHPVINLPDDDIVTLYYNQSINRFTINNTNTSNAMPVFTYSKSIDKIMYNTYPGLICVETAKEIPEYKIAGWSYNYNEHDKAIEWERFYIINEETRKVDYIEANEFVLPEKAEFGRYLIIFDAVAFKVDIIYEPTFLPEKCVILDLFVYSKDGIKVNINKINDLIPMEKELNQLAKLVDEKLLDIDSTLVLSDKIYIVNDNPILKTSMSVSGSPYNAITIIDSDNRISYPGMEVRFSPGKNTIYSGKDSKDIEVFKYTLEEVEKEYKFGIISTTELRSGALPFPGEVLFDTLMDTTYENIVGMDTSSGVSPFMRIAGSLDKEKYPAWCFRRTGAKNELSYAVSNDKSGDFYIFDLRYYLLFLGVNDNNSLTHIIINSNYNKHDTALESLKILYTLIHDAYPNINIGFAPMIKHESRESNIQISANKKNCELINKVIKLISSIDAKYNTSVLPLWLYVNPMVNVEDAMIREVWNCIVGWACSTL